VKKNRGRTLHLHRETVARLDRLEIRAEDLDNVDGGSILDHVSTGAPAPYGCACVK
jgi:hypothetical protein